MKRLQGLALCIAIVSASGHAQTAASGMYATRVIEGDVTQVQGVRSTAFQRCVGSAHAGMELKKNNFEQLAQVHRELGFQYVRFHGVFTDDMGVYREQDGKAVYDWARVDELYDKVLTAGMKPFVELGFMPEALASGGQHIFFWNANVTPPKDMAKWAALVTAFVTHLQGRYGQDEVKSWYFEVWNEPNYMGFWPKTDQAAYFQMYDATAAAVKGVNAAYRVGGPATAGAGWVPDFLDHATKQGSAVDFVSTHTYAVSQGFIDTDGNADLVLSQDEQSITGDVKNVRKQIDASAKPGLPLEITEWSSSYSSRDPVHDSYTNAAFVLEKLKSVVRDAESMSYWTYSDLFEENGPPPAAFHGGFGLLTRDDIRKPSFFAYKYLNELGPTELKDSDRHSWITTDGSGVKAVIWNYAALKQDEGNKAFFRKAHPPASMEHVELKLAHVPPGKYVVEVHRTGYKANDAYTAYIEMGLPKDLSTEQTKVLTMQTEDRPESTARVTVGTDGNFEKTMELRQNDIVYVSLVKQ